MRITNRYGLPDQFVRYLESTEAEHVRKPGRYSATELLEPPLVQWFKRTYPDDVEEDVADCVPALLGTAVHTVMERMPHDDDVRVELSVETEFEGRAVCGRIDRLDLGSRTVEDYKTCSVSKVMRSDFEDWRLQGLIYAWLVWRSMDVRVERIRFYAIMKDWSKVKAATSANYPQTAIFVWERDVADSDLEYIEGYVRERIAEIEAERPRECAPEERWNVGDRYAVMKDGRKTAVKVFDSEAEAQAFAEGIEGSRVERRPGQDLRCDLYCPVRRLCKKGGGE